ncbi:MAG: hypothetical protein PHO80_02530 [Candidatus Gracilibacteria bacterium]|nr:hypothetical protein [Candidatus Gracilibacteria bacterium]
MTRFLILSGSYGWGHNYAKNNIQNYLEKNGNEVKSLDFLGLMQNKSEQKSHFYEFVEGKKILGKLTQYIIDKKITNSLIDLNLQITTQKKFNKEIEKYKPNYIICTFPLWPLLIKNYLKNHKKTFKVGVIATDTLNICYQWIAGKNAVDYYFVIDKNTKESFEKKFNHTKNNVFAYFFPLEENLFVDKEKIENKNICMILSSCIREKIYEEFLEKMQNKDFFEKLIIIKGRNDKIYANLKRKFYNINSFEFKDFFDIKENLKNIDIMITKPGGSIISECIAGDIFMICPGYNPGQEKQNAQFVEEVGIGVQENNPEKMVNLIEANNFNQFLKNYGKIKNKKAIESIINKMTEK